MNEEPERRNNVTRRECDLTHEPIVIFMVDTKTSIEGLHKKLNSGLALIIANLASIITALIVFMVTKRGG